MLLQQEMEVKKLQDWNLIQSYPSYKRVWMMLRFKMPVMKVAKT